MQVSMIQRKFLVHRKDSVRGKYRTGIMTWIETNHQYHSQIFHFLDGKAEISLHGGLSLCGKIS